MNLENMDKKQRYKRAEKIHSFIRSIENNGYIIDDFAKVTKLTEKIGNGDDTPITNFTTLMNLKVQLNSFDIDKLSNNFRDEIRLSLDEVTKLMKENTKAPLIVDQTNNLTEFDKFNRLLNQIKTSAGVLLDVNRVEEATQNRNKTYQKILDLSNNRELSPTKKMTEYKRLLHIYNGPNLDAIHAAKNITARGNISLTDEKINELVNDFNELYQEIMKMYLDDQTKKNMIDIFSKIAKICTKYKANLSKRSSYKKRYDKLSKELGVSSSFIRNEEKTVEYNTEEIKVENEMPIEETKQDFVIDITQEEKSVELEEVKVDKIEEENNDFEVRFTGKTQNTFGTNIININELEEGKTYVVEDVKVINGIQHYKLYGFDTLYDSSIFDQTKEFDDNDFDIEINEPEKNVLDNSEEDIGLKAQVVKNVRPGLGSELIKGVAITGLIAAYYFPPVAFVSAAMWIYASLRDRYDIKKHNGLFKAIFSKLSNNVNNSKEITNEDKFKTLSEVEEIILDLDSDELEKGMSK